MPRHYRILGETQWAHVILRGINRENLFYDAEDYQRFISTLDRYRQECQCEIAAYCLMSNHVHLVMWLPKKEYAQMMKKVAVSYSAYYNKKYERVGHVFQDRYKSELIDSERYLLTVVRYVYKNPEKGGICRAGKYPYTYIDIGGILSNYFNSRVALMSFLESDSDDQCMEYKNLHELNDNELLDLLVKLTGNSNPLFIQQLNKKKRDSIICELRKQGASVRQISRLTGISRSVVQRASAAKNGS